MTRWVAFAALTLTVLAAVLFSARASERVISDLTADEPAVSDAPPLPPTALLANVAGSHALFAVVLLAGIWLAAVPASSLGIGGEPSGLAAVAIGIGVGLALAAVNLALGAVVDTDPSAALRELLAPDSSSGWVVLLGVVLPIIAGFEELLFRAILIGAFSTGFELSPWLLAITSSIAFALGHGAQGRVGVVATGVFGVALASVFVLTGSLLVVAVAHYVVNAVEFTVLEGIGYDPSGVE
ncbi:CPBP family intramembrane glutamic endopeptidase [Natronomonas salsuginis]|uniref:CPBP family intramembrane metalloprotease n=1 Tax=Natronomonas salsuginis TaxID=2217661 RepID=A0A4U5J987_9EURY|nr:CPBP family intramembrane glutamic endopeptidase [Natronomonas salsuginis]TKR25672.1 CPBP family intramembrane metalloprotease [Natronomonas salsuginis]